MTACSPREALHQMGTSMGMTERTDHHSGCGVYMVGDGSTTQGSLWYYQHHDLFAVSRCDLMFTSDTFLTLPPQSTYIALRLDETAHLAPRKIVAFMEEQEGSASGYMQKGMKVSYTEVLYFPAFYKQHLSACFSKLTNDPAHALKCMDREYNWPPEMINILTSVRDCELTGTVAELFLVGKSYELMAILLKMSETRSPKKPVDYEGLVNVIDHIENNLDRPIKQQDLARKANMSPTKLKNLFKRFTGKTITDYILDSKADKASRFLAETTMSIEDISKLLGFETATGFSTSFKKRLGISPSAYRRHMAFDCIVNPSEKNLFSFGKCD